MHYDFGEVAMDIPIVLLDETTYAFKDKKAGRALLVSTSPPLPNITPDVVSAELIEQLDQGFPGGAPILSQEDITFLGAPARKTALLLKSGGADASMHLMAATGNWGITLIRLIIDNPSGIEGAVFDYILASAATPHGPFPPPAPGYVRRQTGPFSIELPSSLPAPQGFVFSTQDRSVRITLQYEAQPAQKGPPPFREGVAISDPDEESLDLVSDHETPFIAQGRGLSGWDGRWEVRHLVSSQEMERYVFRKLSLEVRDDLSFRVLGVARAAGAPAIDSIWTQLTGTVRRGG